MADMRFEIKLPTLPVVPSLALPLFRFTYRAVAQVTSQPPRIEPAANPIAAAARDPRATDIARLRAKRQASALEQLDAKWERKR